MLGFCWYPWLVQFYQLSYLGDPISRPRFCSSGWSFRDQLASLSDQFVAASSWLSTLFCGQQLEVDLLTIHFPLSFGEWHRVISFGTSQTGYRLPFGRLFKQHLVSPFDFPSVSALGLQLQRLCLYFNVSSFLLSGFWTAFIWACRCESSWKRVCWRKSCCNRPY